MAFRELEFGDFVKIRCPKRPNVHGLFGEIIEKGNVYHYVDFGSGKDWFSPEELLVADRESHYRQFVHHEVYCGDDGKEVVNLEDMDYDDLLEYAREQREEVSRLREELQRF